jgi:hypothetical protein
MMFDEIDALLRSLPESTSRHEYHQQIVELNLLSKPTKKTRQLTLRHLVELYGLDPSLPLFRAFRRLWTLEKDARPILALSMALARDPLLRISEDFILAKAVGESLTRDELVRLLEREQPHRFSDTSLQSIARNISGSWSRAGFFSGKVRKIRSRPKITPVNAAFSVFLGYLEGLSGQRLFSTRWTNLLECSVDELAGLLTSAANRGLLVFMNAGGVVEVRFPGYLSIEEEQWINEQNH